jgi:hypothetical protein
MVKQMRSETATQITCDFDRDYETVLGLIHEVQETSGTIGAFELSEVWRPTRST